MTRGPQDDFFNQPEEVFTKYLDMVWVDVGRDKVPSYLSIWTRKHLFWPYFIIKHTELRQISSNTILRGGEPVILKKMSWAFKWAPQVSFSNDVVAFK